jgi:hypothetical protein
MVKAKASHFTAQLKCEYSQCSVGRLYCFKANMHTVLCDSPKISLILQPTVGRPVCLGIKHPSGAYNQIFITVRQLQVCSCGVLSVMRWQVCRLQSLLALASAVILRSEPVGLVTIFYCLRFETSLSVPSYDSQGYGGGIQPHLHMVLNWSPVIPMQLG